MTEQMIKTLQQEPSGDLISRQAVLDLIEHYNSDGLGAVFIDYQHGIKFADTIKNLPSVNPQKIGHWEYGYAFADGNYCKCSKCKEIIKCTYPMHYCPNCGAKMIEQKESEVEDAT